MMWAPVPAHAELERIREAKCWMIRETNGHPVKVFCGRFARIESLLYLHFVERES